MNAETTASSLAQAYKSQIVKCERRRSSQSDVYSICACCLVTVLNGFDIDR